MKSWAEKYKEAGLVVIGVHTPEFSFEKERVNLENALRDLKVTYPIAIDSDYRIWQALWIGFRPGRHRRGSRASSLSAHPAKGCHRGPDL